MDGKSRVFRPEAEKVWHEDYQCEYYRGVIIDGEDNIVERCAKMHPNYTAAFSDAVEKMSVSPLILFVCCFLRYLPQDGRNHSDMFCPAKHGIFQIHFLQTPLRWQRSLCLCHVKYLLR